MITSRFQDVADQQVWTEATQVALLLQYIENQQSDDAFLDFIAEQAEE